MRKRREKCSQRLGVLKQFGIHPAAITEVVKEYHNITGWPLVPARSQAGLSVLKSHLGLLLALPHTIVFA